MSEHKRKFLDTPDGGQLYEGWPGMRDPRPPGNYTGPGNRNISDPYNSRLNGRPAAIDPAPVGKATDLDCGCSFRVPMDAEEEDYLISGD